MKKILISGGEGNFAKEILKYNKKFEIFTPSKKEMNIENLNSVIKFIKKTKIHYFIHSAALTRPMSQHNFKIEQSIKTNIVGTANVVIACQKFKVKLIYISTNLVYPGIVGNYKENQAILPVNAYAWSKLGGESAVHLYKNSLILRTCMTDNIYPHKVAFTDYITSFIKKSEAAKLVLKLLDKYGIINLGGKTQSSYDFAKDSNNKIKKKNLTKQDIILIGKNTSININKIKNIKF